MLEPSATTVAAESHEEDIDMFKELLRELSATQESGREIVKGALIDPKTNAVCAVSTLLIREISRASDEKLVDAGIPNAVREESRHYFDSGQFVAPPGTAIHAFLSGLTQFQADDALAKLSGVNRAFVADCAAADFGLVNLPASRVLLAELAQLDTANDSHSPEGDLISVYGVAGPRIVAFFQYLESRSRSDWGDIRQNCAQEFKFCEELAANDLQATSVAAANFDSRLIGAAQYQARVRCFRNSWSALFGDPKMQEAALGQPIDRDRFEWNAAWPSWAADLARRAAIEQMAISVTYDGAHPLASTMLLFKFNQV